MLMLLGPNKGLSLKFPPSMTVTQSLAASGAVIYSLLMNVLPHSLFLNNPVPDVKHGLLGVEHVAFNIFIKNFMRCLTSFLTHFFLILKVPECFLIISSGSISSHMDVMETVIPHKLLSQLSFLQTL